VGLGCSGGSVGVVCGCWLGRLYIQVRIQLEIQPKTQAG